MKHELGDGGMLLMSRNPLKRRPRSPHIVQSRRLEVWLSPGREGETPVAHRWLVWIIVIYSGDNRVLWRLWASSAMLYVRLSMG